VNATQARIWVVVDIVGTRLAFQGDREKKKPTLSYAREFDALLQLVDLFVALSFLS
jgi:hypothetical protein